MNHPTEEIRIISSIERRFQALFEHSSDMISLFDEDLKLIYQNSSFKQITGWTDLEEKDVNPVDEIHPDDAAGFYETIRRVLAHPGKPFIILLRFKHREGHYLWLKGILTNLLDDPAIGGIVSNFQDITNRKQDEQDLQKSYKDLSDYKYALDEACIVAITDQEGIIKHVNDNFCMLSKYSREELIGQDHRILNSGYHSKAFIRDLWKTIKMGKIWKGELKNKAKDGSYYWVDGAIVPFLNEHGKPYQYVALHSDITPRKHAEEEVKQKARQIEDILERITDGFIALDNNLNYTYANCQIGKMTGRDPKSLLGKHIWTEFPQAVGSATWKAVNRALEEQCYVCETDYYAPFDLWQENRIYPSANGLFIFIRDISREKRDEQELRSAYQRLSFHFTNTPLAVIELSRDGKIMQWSHRAETIFGWKESEVKDKHFNELNLNFDEDSVKIGTAMSELIRTGSENGVSNISRNKTKAGETIYIEWYNSVLKDEQGEVVSIVSLAQDITLRKKGEEEIKALNDGLELKVKERTEELEQAIKDLESFSYSVSHDLRAPLRAVNGYSIILKDMLGDKFDASTDRIIGTILSSTRMMGHLIDDLLKFSRMGRKELISMPVNMNKLVKESILELKKSDPEKKYTIHTDILPVCVGDQVMLRQVWINLIGNAIKYSSRQDHSEIRIGYTEDESNCTYFVSDNGVGFDMAHSHKLFGVFQRLHSYSEFEGTGIGLALVKRIIDKHHGKVWAKGKLGEGAIFYFNLFKYTPNDK